MCVDFNVVGRKLYVKLSRDMLWFKEASFLEQDFSQEMVPVNLSKVDVVLLLGAPKSVTEIGSFWSSIELLLQFV